MAKRKAKETPATVTDVITVESQGDVTVLELNPTEDQAQPTEKVVIDTIGSAIRNLGIFKFDDYDVATETSNILEAAMKLHGQGKTTADHMTNMVLMLENNKETSREEKLDAYGKLLKDTFIAISKLGYDPILVFNEHINVIEAVQKKRPTKADYSKAKV